MLTSIPANENHFEQILPLLFETGYYEYAALGNKLNLSAHEFYKIQTLEPYLKHTYVIQDNGNFAGFYIAATKSQVKEIEKKCLNLFRDDSDLLSILEPISKFYDDETLDSDLIVYNAAIHPDYRGKGIFWLKRCYINLAKKNNCLRIVFTVWKSKSGAQIFKLLGAKYVGELRFNQPFIKDTLLKAVLELTL